MPKAFELYQDAIKLKSSEAMCNLAFCSENGVENDLSQAIQLYRKAIRYGNARAMNNLAIFYENGNGVKKAYQKLLNCIANLLNWGI
jgi:TPR repeat protein